MLISTERINDSMARLRKARIEPSRLAGQLGEGDRSRYVSERQRNERLRSLMGQVEDPAVARLALERILGGNDLSSVNYLALGAQRARSVCRVHLRDESGATTGYGTGFLIGPGVLMTNHHVIANSEQARHSLAEFDYEYDVQGRDKPVAAFHLLGEPEPIALEALDFCLVGVAKTSVDGRRLLDGFGWLTVNPTPGKAIVGEYLTIVQHPGGERKQVCVRENKLLKYDDNGSTLWYQTDTVAGSSGSPVFSLAWEVVALHHLGVPATDAQGRWMTTDGRVWDSSMGEGRVKWIANEGVRISAICEYVRSRQAGHPLAAPILNPQPAPVEMSHQARTDPAASVGTEYVDDELRVTIPVCVAVRVGASSRTQAAQAPPQVDAAPGVARSTPAAVPASSIEAVNVIQSNYSQRTGYRPDFLGDGDGLRVPLPRVGRASLKRQILTFGSARNSELKYWTYSVVMNKARQLAFFSAANVDAERRPSGAGREGDRWYFDTRIDEEAQLAAEFYGQQREFEASRDRNPFDRGHLTRRLDAQWGASTAQAKRNGDDSFHWTNCSPQHYRFNQGAKLWLGLEDYVIDGFAKDSSRRACVINGPIFDAPLSALDAAGRVAPDLRGRPHADPTFGGVAIPKQFFKVVACARHERGLAAAGFLMSQEDLLAGVNRIHGMPALSEEKLSNAEARLYQVPIADLARLTGLDFGPLSEAEVTLDEAAEERRPRRIERLEDVRM